MSIKILRNAAGHILRRRGEALSTEVKYGYLYNFYAAVDSRKISSSDDWVVPSLTQINTFISYVSTNKDKLREIGTTYWNAPNINATNEYGFNARGAGWRSGFDSIFRDLKASMSLFLSTGTPNADYLLIGSTNQISSAFYRHGFSIRFIYIGSGTPTTYTGNDGKVYQCVQIGTQTWLAENLMETKYRDGSPITEVTGNSAWAALTTGARCSYDNNESNAGTTTYGIGKILRRESVVFTPINYGALYNWYAASNANFAPAGWHLPTKTEWDTLITYLGGVSVAGGKLKETGTIHWNSPNTGATNEVLFNGRGGGYRQIPTGESQLLNIQGYYMGTHLGVAYFLQLSNSSAIANSNYGSGANRIGQSVRLLKDDSTDPGSLTDIDGNVYPTVKIGDQVWLAANWACTKLNDGTPIANVTDNAAWAALTTGAYCWYNNDINNG